MFSTFWKVDGGGRERFLLLWVALLLFPLLLGGAAWPPPPSVVLLFSPLLLRGAALHLHLLGEAAFPPAPWAGVLFSGSQHHLKEEVEGNTTKRRREAKQPHPKWREGKGGLPKRGRRKEHHPKEGRRSGGAAWSPPSLSGVVFFPLSAVGWCCLAFSSFGRCCFSLFRWCACLLARSPDGIPSSCLHWRQYEVLLAQMNCGRNYNNLEVKKTQLLTALIASITSLAIGVNREPLFGQPCMGVPTHLVQALTNASILQQKAMMSSGALATGWAYNNFGLQVLWGLHGELPAKLSCSGAHLLRYLREHNISCPQTHERPRLYGSPLRGTRPYRHVCLPPLVRARLACSHCMGSQPTWWHSPACLTHAVSPFFTGRPCARSWTVPDTHIFCSVGREGNRRAVR